MKQEVERRDLPLQAKPHSRRDFLLGAATAALALTTGGLSSPARAQAIPGKADMTIRIAPVTLELAPGHVIKTVGYNAAAPGPLIRLREGQQITIAVVNDTQVPELVHWHGLFVPSEVDGSMEEGTPMVMPGATASYSFTAKPAGTRWYHSHAMAGKDLTQSLYAGQYGFLYVEPRNDPGRYDQEVFIAMHHWEPYFVSMQDIRKGPPPDNGLEVAYKSASFNDKALGHGEPLRVRQGQRVLFRLLNASATDDVMLALPGHRFTVLALDGNPVPSPRTVDSLMLAPAERIDAVVEMNNPGVWIFGSAEDEVRQMGMGVVVEYANAAGAPQWQAPPMAMWDYLVFGRQSPVPEPDGRFDLTFQKIVGGRGGFNRWTINGKSWPDTDPLMVERGKRYRLIFRNDSGDMHPLHLHRHSFELVRFAGKPTAGIRKDVVNVPKRETVEVDFVADHPGLSLLHCHMQEHQDFGFMTLVKYA
jgi:FtsP/CotA-like multicopper oxidase with cupredoxin domain